MMENDFLNLTSEEEVREMVEFLMRSTLNLQAIKQEPIFGQIDDEVVEQHYYAILNDLKEKEKEVHLSNFKNHVFQIIRQEHPIFEEEVLYLIQDYAEELPLLFQISTDELLNIWDMKYKEPNTELEFTFGEWAALYRRSHERMERT